MPKDDRLEELTGQTRNALTWILDRPNHVVTLGDIFRLAGSVRVLLDHLALVKKIEEEQQQATASPGS